MTSKSRIKQMMAMSTSNKVSSSVIVSKKDIHKPNTLISSDNTSNEQILSQNKIELDLNIEKNILSEPYFTLENIFSNDILKEFEDHELGVPSENANYNNTTIYENRNNNDNC